ncbi:hypothetical protein ACFSQQ_00035 [Mesorhizobium kowhaii]|uniref:hypothetical protein n=1 Tax=Mesorhizobium kowhaii TaxID=1300272 RepID=UPI0035F03B92
MKELQKSRIQVLVGIDVTRVSANAEVDERSGATSFTATIEVVADQFEALPYVKLYPDMPVDVSIVTGERKGIVRAATLAAGLTSVGIV